MLASARLTRSAITRRAAFTLVEVLVVVAIVVILASIGTLATFKFLEDAKVDAARAKAEQLQVYARAWAAKHEGNQISSDTIVELADYAEDGQRALMSPFDTPYQAQLRNDPATGKQRLFIYCVYENPNTGQQFEYGAPKEMEQNGQ